MVNQVLQSFTYDPWLNLAVEEYIINNIKPNEAWLYLWQNQKTIVIGSAQNAWRECRTELLENEGGRLARRSSGGGAVFHDLGNLNFTFIMPHFSYDIQRQLSVIVEACNMAGIEAIFTGRNDIIAADGRKFSGNAFKQTKKCAMQHGTLLIDADMQLLERYLSPSKAKLNAKGIESVKARVCNLKEFNSQLTCDIMREHIIAAFEKEYGKAEHIALEDLDRRELAILRNKYSSWEYKYGDTPSFDVEFNNRFDWGEISILLSLKNGRIEKASVFSDSMDVELAEKISAALAQKPYGKQISECIAEISQEAADVANWLAKEEY